MDTVAERKEARPLGAQLGVRATRQLDLEATTMKQPNLRAVLGLTSAAYFMAVLDSLVVVTALPSIGASLHVGLQALQWTVNAYGIALAAGIISAAAVGDRFGRRRIFVAGVVLFTAGSAVCGLAGSSAMLIAARAIQGLGGAALLTLSLTILTDAFPAQRRGTVIGIYGGLAGLAVAAGPLVGGAVTQGADWRWIFWINVPIGLITAALSARLLPESRGRERRVDATGVALVSGGAVSLVWGLVRGPSLGWGSAQVLAALIAGIALLVAFVGWEARTPSPMVPLRLFADRTFAAGAAAMFMMTGSIFAGGFLIIQYAQLARGYSPVMTGVRLLPWLIMPMLVSPLAGALSDRIGQRRLIASGLALQAAGFGWVALRVGAGLSYGELAGALLVAGVGIGMALPTAPTAVLGAVARHELGTASGVATTLQRFGAVFATAVATAVLSGTGGLGSAAAFTAGMGPALGVCAGISLCGALVSLGIRPEPIRAATPAAQPVPAGS
ncbi:MAG TPA: DHA2 family efflux MFS transporter permease subunit [Kofleriaceae bacterium]|nr:DHA2 family efflux MFS transporter permease subunit [Kofleriaceae bacterium]